MRSLILLVVVLCQLFASGFIEPLEKPHEKPIPTSRFARLLAVVTLVSQTQGFCLPSPESNHPYHPELNTQIAKWHKLYRDKDTLNAFSPIIRDTGIPLSYEVDKTHLGRVLPLVQQSAQFMSPLIQNNNNWHKVDKILQLAQRKHDERKLSLVDGLNTIMDLAENTESFSSTLPLQRFDADLLKNVSPVFLCVKEPCFFTGFFACAYEKALYTPAPVLYIRICNTLKPGGLNYLLHHDFENIVQFSKNHSHLKLFKPFYEKIFKIRSYLLQEKLNSELIKLDAFLFLAFQMGCNIQELYGISGKMQQNDLHIARSQIDQDAREWFPLVSNFINSINEQSYQDAPWIFENIYPLVVQDKILDQDLKYSIAFDLLKDDVKEILNFGYEILWGLPRIQEGP